MTCQEFSAHILKSFVFTQILVIPQHLGLNAVTVFNKCVIDINVSYAIMRSSDGGDHTVFPSLTQLSYQLNEYQQ